MRMLVVLAGFFMCAACAPDTDGTLGSAPEGSGVGASSAESAALAFSPDSWILEDEPVSSQAEAFTRVEICQLACQTAFALGCAVVSAQCVSATIITIGGATIPCSMAIIAACGVVPVGIALCQKGC